MRVVCGDGVIRIQQSADIGETKYYVLNVSNQKCLSNRFRYITALLLQGQTDAPPVKADSVAKSRSVEG